MSRANIDFYSLYFYVNRFLERSLASRLVLHRGLSRYYRRAIAITLVVTISFSRRWPNTREGDCPRGFSPQTNGFHELDAAIRAIAVAVAVKTTTTTPKPKERGDV